MMRNEATMDEMNMAMNNSRYAEDHKIHVRFHYEPMLDKKATEEQGMPVFKDVLWAAVTPPGGRTQDQPMSKIDRKRWAARLKQWEDSQGDPEGIVGFRIEEWPAITRSQAETLKHQRIFTVEQLADTPDGNLQGIMGGMLLKQRAQAYLEKVNGTQAQLEALKKRLAELEAKEEPKKRGRPAKIEA